jgi:proton-coupled amino acid transporter
MRLYGPADNSPPSSSALGYAAFGKNISTVVLVNLNQEDRFVNVVQFLYSIAIMLSTPLQLFPAVRIMEQGIFDVKSGKYSNRVKWQKNIFRSLTVLGCALISWAGARDLDKFVSLIGSAACVPLCFCYPPLLHYKACARTFRAKAIDLTLIVFGLAMAFYTTIQTLVMLANGTAGGGAPPNYGKCKPPV